MKPRQVLAAAIAVVGSIWLIMSQPAAPTPAPLPPGEFSLRGKFIGPTAADDCYTFGLLCESLAEIVEFDGMTDPPRLTTAAAIDDLRRTAREFRMGGVSIGSRQPAAAQAIGDYLTERLGVDGGPVTAAKRSEWVTAFRAIARACDDAISR